jgi:hypothetical protein
LQDQKSSGDSGSRSHLQHEFRVVKAKEKMSRVREKYDVKENVIGEEETILGE